MRQGLYHTLQFVLVEYGQTQAILACTNLPMTAEDLRECLKDALCQLHITICGRFSPNEGGVAGYGNRMRRKYTAKWGLQGA